MDFQLTEAQSQLKEAAKQMVAREIELCLEPVCAAGRLPDAAEEERIEALLAALKSAAQ